MSIKDRKKREKEKLRQKILDTAAEILINEGIEKCTIRKVAEKIEYSPRTVYLYFQDKDDLLGEIIEKGFELSVTQMEQARDEFTDDNPRELIRFQLRNNVQNALNAPNFYKAIVYLLHFKNYKAGPFQKKQIEGVRSDIFEMHKKLDLPTDDIDNQVELLYGMIRGLNLVLISKQQAYGNEEMEKLITQGINAIMEGLLKSQ